MFGAAELFARVDNSSYGCFLVRQRSTSHCSDRRLL